MLRQLSRLMIGPTLCKQSPIKVLVSQHCISTRRLLPGPKTSRTLLKRTSFIKKIICPDDKSKKKKKDDCCCISKEEFKRLKKLDGSCQEEKKDCLSDGCKICKKASDSLSVKAKKILAIDSSKKQKKPSKKKKEKRQDCCCEQEVDCGLASQPKADCAVKKDDCKPIKECETVKKDACETIKKEDDKCAAFKKEEKRDCEPLTWNGKEATKNGNGDKNCYDSSKNGQENGNGNPCKNGQKESSNGDNPCKNGQQNGQKENGNNACKNGQKESSNGDNPCKNGQQNGQKENGNNACKNGQKENGNERCKKENDKLKIRSNLEKCKDGDEITIAIKIQKDCDVDDPKVNCIGNKLSVNNEFSGSMTAELEKEENAFNEEKLALAAEKRKIAAERTTLENERKQLQEEERIFHVEKVVFDLEKKMLTDLKNYIEHFESECSNQKI